MGVAGVAVRIQAEGQPEVLATVRTDASGRYQFAGAPDYRLKLSVAASGYFTRKVRGRVAQSVVVQCAGDQDCAGIDFELARAAVVAGRVTDELNEPLQRIAISLTPSSAGASSYKGSTDDRGMFRIPGVEAGEYKLQAAESAPLYPHDVSYQSEAAELKLKEGEEITGLRLVLRRTEKFRVSGVVTGVDLPAGQAVIEAEPREESGLAARWSPTAAVGEGGRFDFWSLPGGQYRFVLRIPPGPGAAGRPRTVNLQALEIDRNMAGLVLEPLPPTGVAGTVRPAAGATPASISLVFVSKDGTGRILPASAPNYRFEGSDLAPGSYDIRTLSTDWYVKGLGEEGAAKLLPPNVNLQPGQVATVEVVLGADFGQVYGRMKEAGAGAAGQAAAHYRVALAGPGGIRSVQADQSGRFVFPKVIPGPYRICAWKDLNEGAVRAEPLWKQAGKAVRAFAVDPGAQIEMDLTAAP